jgi:hypothetical protein
MIMNKGTQMNLSQLAATATLGELALADTQGKLKLTKLPPAKAKRSQMVYTGGLVNAGRGSGRSQKVG